MTSLFHTTLIEKPLSDVYALAQDVERYPEFLPGYIESRIVARTPRGVLLARKARVRGREHAWRSWVRFTPLQTIVFEHAAGPLEGTEVEWRFDAVAEHSTRLQIRHRLQVRSGGPFAWFAEKLFFAPRVNKLAAQVVAAFRDACERSEVRA
jgi:coenzyme Q-binding protein COQ10